MNDNVDPALAGGPDADNTTSPPTEPKPKPARRKRAAEVAQADAATVTDTPAAGADVGDTGEGEPAAPKPRRKRSAPVAEAGPEIDADGGVDRILGAAREASEGPRGSGQASGSAVAPQAEPSTAGGGDQQNGGGRKADGDGDGDSDGDSDGDRVGQIASVGNHSEGAASSGDEGDANSNAMADGTESPRSRRRNRRERNRRAAREDGAAGDGQAGAFVGPLAAKPAAPEAAQVFEQVLSGVFDTDVEAPIEEEEAADTKRVLAPEPDAPKLHKVLAQSGIGSRRDMEELIADGFVTVNGEPAHTGQRVSFGDQVQVKGKLVRLRIVPPPPRIIAYHKPVGEIVTHDDPQHRPTVFRRLPRLQQGKWQSVGRLDINTEGLLLFTTSGGLANQLMHPRFGVEREYAVRVLGTLSESDKAELLEGVDVDGQKAQFRSINDGGGEGANHWYRCVITEGRNREVRKLFDAVELTVSRLIRIRYGTVVLPHGLKRGAWVDLDENDIRAIRRLAAGDGNSAERQPQHAPRGEQRQVQAGLQPRQNGPRNKNDRQRQGGQGGPGGQGNGTGNFQGHGQNNNNGSRPRQDDQRPPMAASEEREPHFERDDDAEVEIDHRLIPNPLEQTFDKRFVQNPRMPAGGRGFGRGGGGFGAGGSAPPPPDPHRGPGPRQPDPLQTSVGYIGADAFHRKNKNRGPRGGGGGFGGGSGGGGGGGGGYQGGNGGGNQGSGGGGRRGR